MIYDSFYPVILPRKKNQWDTEPGAEAVFCGRCDNTLRFSNFMNGEKLSNNISKCLVKTRINFRGGRYQICRL